MHKNLELSLPFLKALSHIAPFLLYRRADKYYKKQLDLISASVDFVLIIKGEMVTKKTINLIRKKWPHAKIVLYLYDSVKSVKNISSKTRFYDKVYSFDSEDCKKYGFSFRPLFCDNPRVSLNDVDDKNKYDLCFYGTMHGDRFAVLNEVAAFCEKEGISLYRFCYLPAWFMKFYYFITNRGYRHFDKKLISLTPKTQDELADIISSSFAVLDVNDKSQSGLTIRTFEALFAGKRIITTNPSIAEYSFYDPENILIIDRKKVSIPESFFSRDVNHVKYKDLEKYTAKGWLDDVFDEI